MRRKGIGKTFRAGRTGRVGEREKGRGPVYASKEHQRTIMARIDSTIGVTEQDAARAVDEFQQWGVGRAYERTEVAPSTAAILLYFKRSDTTCKR